MTSKPRKRGDVNRGKAQKPLLIPEEEQWRIINETGVLRKVPSNAVQEDDKEDETHIVDEILNSMLLIIPFSFLLLMMDVLIHFQYGKHPTFRKLLDRVSSGAPILAIFIFYTTRYKADRRMQLLLFVLSIVCGSRMLFIVNQSSWLVNMRQCPPLATIWIYTIVQLELAPAVLSLLLVGIYVWWKGLSIQL